MSGKDCRGLERDMHSQPGGHQEGCVKEASLLGLKEEWASSLESGARDQDGKSGSHADAHLLLRSPQRTATTIQPKTSPGAGSYDPSDPLPVR